jgi:AcrR family transcriptional regulator
MTECSDRYKTFMSVREDQRERVLERLSAHFIATGLGEMSLRQLAAAAGVSDRMLLYYFADKAEVLRQSLFRVADNFVAVLDTSLPDDRVAADVLMIQALTLVRAPALRPSMRLWLQIVAAAAAGEPPFPDVAAAIIDGFLDWLSARMDVADPAAGREAAALILATIDGLAMFDAIGREDLTDAAMRFLR